MLVRPLDADDDMVVDRHLHVAAGVDQVAGQADVLARLGVGSPLGWLWTMMIAVAPSAMARAMTSRTWTEASSTLPCHKRLVGDQHVLGVEEQDPHLLDLLWAIAAWR